MKNEKMEVEMFSNKCMVCGKAVAKGFVFCLPDSFGFLFHKKCLPSKSPTKKWLTEAVQKNTKRLIAKNLK